MRLPLSVEHSEILDVILATSGTVLHPMSGTAICSCRAAPRLISETRFQTEAVNTADTARFGAAALDSGTHDLIGTTLRNIG